MEKLKDPTSNRKIFMSQVLKCSLQQIQQAHHLNVTDVQGMEGTLKPRERKCMQEIFGSLVSLRLPAGQV